MDLQQFQTYLQGAPRFANGQRRAVLVVGAGLNRQWGAPPAHGCWTALLATVSAAVGAGPGRSNGAATAATADWEAMVLRVAEQRGVAAHVAEAALQRQVGRALAFPPGWAPQGTVLNGLRPYRDIINLGDAEGVAGAKEKACALGDTRSCK